MKNNTTRLHKSIHLETQTGPLEIRLHDDGGITGHWKTWDGTSYWNTGSLAGELDTLILKSRANTEIVKAAIAELEEKSR